MKYAHVCHHVFVLVTEPESTTTREALATQESSDAAPMHFSILFIAVVLGVVILLVLLLIFGVAWKQGEIL